MDVRTAEASRWKKYYLNNERLISGWLSVVLFLTLWELVVSTGLINPVFASSPLRILSQAVFLLGESTFWYDIYTSFIEFGIGFALAMGIGIPIGLAAGWYRKVEYWIDPYLSALYATPRAAFVPLLVLWLGLGVWSKIAVVFMGAFFPITINTIAGTRTIDELILKAARSFGASDRLLFRAIILPSSVPFILTGLRLGVGRALVGIVIAELYAAQAGIGYRLMVFGTTFQIDKMFVYIFALAILGITMVEILKRVNAGLTLGGPMCAVDENSVQVRRWSHDS